MKLSEARELFARIRGDCKILPSKHSFADHPERRFSASEIILLVRQAKGILQENTRAATATSGSYLWKCKDYEGRACELVLMFSEDQDGNVIIVISAWR